jgi:hypothetical protein
MNKRTIERTERKLLKLALRNPQPRKPIDPPRLKCVFVLTDDDGRYLTFTCERCGRSERVPGDVIAPVENCRATPDQQQAYEAMKAK